MSKKLEKLENLEQPQFETSYKFCEICERRIHTSLFDDKLACRTCRGLKSNGTPQEKCTKESKENSTLVCT